MKDKLLSVILLCTILFSLSACASSDAPSADGLHIVTTNFALYDFASAVCGENDTVTMLLPPGAESHDYEVSFADMAILEKCDLLFCVGGESEEWVGKALLALSEYDSAPETLCALDVIRDAGKLLCEATVLSSDEAPDHDHDHSHAEDYTGMDEHVWTAIPNAVLLMDTLDETLAGLDEDHVTGRHEAYAASLSALDEKFRSLTANTADPRIIVADRFPFLYMAEEYGIGYYAAFAGCASDTEPSVAVVNTLIGLVKDTGAKTVFVIEFSDRRTAELIAAETGADVAELHSCHNVSAADFAAGITYLQLMEKNYATLAAAWETANTTLQD